MCTQRKRNSDKVCNQVAQTPPSCQTKHFTYFSQEIFLKYGDTLYEFDPTFRLLGTVMCIKVFQVKFGFPERLFLDYPPILVTLAPTCM